MGAIQEIFRRYGPSYIDKFGDKMPANHLKTIESIINCRTGVFGYTVYECDQCHKFHHVGRGCGNRHCPTCQNGKGLDWLDRQLDKKAPGHHFMITFTVPESIRTFMRGHQKKAYGALFKASSKSMKKLARDKKHIGGDLPGFTGILHTWGRQMQYHPHIQTIAPGGAFNKLKGTSACSRLDFFLPVRALSKIFRAKFRDQMKAEGLFNLIDPKAWKVDWNVNIQAVGSGSQTVRYLSRYVFKAAIADYRIDSFENGQVTFRYKKTGSNRNRRITVTAHEFIRRYRKLVLPTGLMKVRHYGFMNSNSSISLADVKGLIEISNEFNEEKVVHNPAPDRHIYCPSCGGKLHYRYSVLPYMINPAFEYG